MGHLLARRLKQGALPFLLAALLPAADYHVDCSGGRDAASGLSPADAWQTLAKANSQMLQPGDRLLLKRGVTCAGTLAPQGSGRPGSPVTLASYGTGPAPRIDAKGAESALKLWNQEYWRVEGIEAGGSTQYGILVSGDTGVMRGIELLDVIARNVTATQKSPLKTKTSGLIVIAAQGEAIFEDVTIDGARAEGTTQWAGIIVNGASWGTKAPERRSRNVTIRNSIAKDVWGDGIVLFQVDHGLIERSAAWMTGMQPRHTIGTPNGLWTWRCADCVVRECESFWSDSPGVDGGAFDIDWGNDRNIVERSYGHDTLAYCIAVFGAGHLVTTESVIRRNVCAGLGRSPRLARHHGAIHLTTWDGGSLDGVVIEDNHIEWDTQVKAEAVRNEAVWSGSRGLVLRRNTIRDDVIPPGTEHGGVLEFRLDGSNDARGLRVLLESAIAQYEAKGLKVVETAGAPRVTYRDAGGKLVRSWDGYAPASEVLWLVRQRMGPPAGR